MRGRRGGVDENEVFGGDEIARDLDGRPSLGKPRLDAGVHDILRVDDGD